MVLRLAFPGTTFVLYSPALPPGLPAATHCAPALRARRLPHRSGCCAFRSNSFIVNRLPDLCFSCPLFCRREPFVFNRLRDSFAKTWGGGCLRKIPHYFRALFWFIYIFIYLQRPCMVETKFGDVELRNHRALPGVRSISENAKSSRTARASARALAQSRFLRRTLRHLLFPRSHPLSSISEWLQAPHQYSWFANTTNESGRHLFGAQPMLPQFSPMVCTHSSAQTLPRLFASTFSRFPYCRAQTAPLRMSR